MSVHLKPTVAGGGLSKDGWRGAVNETVRLEEESLLLT
jgi:hypothetical protein